MASSTLALAPLNPTKNDAAGGSTAKAIVIGVRVVDRGGQLVEVKVFGDKVILDEGNSLQPKVAVPILTLVCFFRH